MASKFDKESAIEMLESGMTYAEVAAEFGVSRQYVHQVCHCPNKPRAHRYRPARYDAMVYAGLANWMRYNRITVKMLSEMSAVKYANIYNILRGRQSPGKKMIDKILRATGMTYEDAFGVGSDG